MIQLSQAFEALLQADGDRIRQDLNNEPDKQARKSNTIWYEDPKEYESTENPDLVVFIFGMSNCASWDSIGEALTELGVES